MVRVATLLIVIVLTGPRAALLCDIFCAASEHSTQGCHTTDADRSEDSQVASVSNCHDQGIASPFLAEANKTETRPTSAVATTPVVVTALADGDSRPVAWWSVFHTEPPGGSSLYTILRI